MCSKNIWPGRFTKNIPNRKYCKIFQECKRIYDALLSYFLTIEYLVSLHCYNSLAIPLFD